MRSSYIPPDRVESIFNLLNPRDRYISRILLSTGFRLDDVIHLRAWQLDRDVLTVKERKTGHVRSVPLPAELRRKPPPVRGGALRYAFPSLRAGATKMHRTTYWRHFRDAARRLGWEGCGYSPHSLRKCYAVALYKRHGLAYVQADLGHTSDAVTVRYALSDALRW